MTQSQNPVTQSDALLARYHAAQAALDAHCATAADSAAVPNAPSASTRARILAHAAQRAHTPAIASAPPHTTKNVAINVHTTGTMGRFDSKNSAANDGQWKIRALASVAVLGLTGLLFLQWDRGTPQEKEVAFSMERPAPAAYPAPAPPTPSAETTAAPNQDASVPATPTPVAPPPPVAPAAPPAHSAAPKPKPTEPPRSNAQAPVRPPIAEAVATAAVQAPKPTPAPVVIAEVAPRAEAAPASTATPAPLPVVPVVPDAPTPAMAAAAPATVPIATGQAARARAPLSLPDSLSADKALGAAPAAAQADASAASARLMSPNLALFAAIREGDAASLQIALARGADKNAKRSGTPAITLCVQSNQIPLVRLLVAAGADVSAIDAQGLTPLAHAQAKGLDEMVKLLLESGAK
ncbi:MAG: ankyrin repeat domain-containing protein [Burkholderiaceae bacterium]